MSKSMKCWCCHYEGRDEEMLLHGETFGKAKVAFMINNYWEEEFVKIKGKRISELDDIPLTYSNIGASSFCYEKYIKAGMVDGLEELMDFERYCNCEICRGPR